MVSGQMPLSPKQFSNVEFNRELILVFPSRDSVATLGTPSSEYTESRGGMHWFKPTSPAEPPDGSKWNPQASTVAGVLLAALATALWSLVLVFVGLLMMNWTDFLHCFLVSNNRFQFPLGGPVHLTLEWIGPW